MTERVPARSRPALVDTVADMARPTGATTRSRLDLEAAMTVDVQRTLSDEQVAGIAARHEQARTTVTRSVASRSITPR